MPSATLQGLAAQANLSYEAAASIVIVLYRILE